MKYPELYVAIQNSIPLTKEGHGSRRKNKCNVVGCEVNRGKEKHNRETSSFNKYVDQQYQTITKESVWD